MTRYRVINMFLIDWKSPTSPATSYTPLIYTHFNKTTL